MIKNPPANSGDASRRCGSGKSFGEGNDNLLQYACLGISWPEELDRLQSMELKRNRP